MAFQYKNALKRAVGAEKGTTNAVSVVVCALSSILRTLL
jgi:hypothetical protein